MYPNPTNGEATIVIEYLADRDVEVKLVNILGAEVMHLFEGNVISNYQSIDADLSNLENGIYFISVYADGKSIVTDKLILYK